MKFFRQLWQQWWFVISLTAIGLGILLNSYFLLKSNQQESQLISSQPVPVRTAKPAQSKSSVPRSPQPPFSQNSVPIKNTPLLGHFPYLEGDISKMLPVGSYALGEEQRFERLMPESAFALMKLIYAAREQDVWIIPVSCFRNLEDQQKLFTAQIQRRGSQEAAAKSSAPSGYSEHHTGYALDLADGHFPKQDISLEFAKTDAFKWMKLHAKEFGFELSFPEHNLQGVNYEPWHWRFIGTPEAYKIFNHLS
jgi:zinc D-Ala-D-Ala carboxypeptidase